VAVRTAITGTLVGEFGGLTPTGRTFTASTTASTTPFERIEDGRIVERRQIVDRASVTDQFTVPSGRP
jgi:predicted ester cyclase